jgi:hypothetical protein
VGVCEAGLFGLVASSLSTAMKLSVSTNDGKFIKLLTEYNFQWATLLLGVNIRHVKYLLCRVFNREFSHIYIQTLRYICGTLYVYEYIGLHINTAFLYNKCIK